MEAIIQQINMYIVYVILFFNKDNTGDVKRNPYIAVKEK